MPYDPRPTTEGGNRGIDIDFLRAAPAGKFKVIWVDTFDGSDGEACEMQGGRYLPVRFDTKEEAVAYADEHGGKMNRQYVYDDKGECVHSAGSF